MNTAIKWAILGTLLVAALLCYDYGFSQGTLGFLVLGAAFELAFWLGVFDQHQPDKRRSS